MRNNKAAYRLIILLKILWSGVANVDGRGKAGGSVWSKGRYGAYVRNKVTPVNRRTPFQQAARSVLSFFAQSFRALTQDQIKAWNSAAANGFKTHNIFGNSISKTGLTLFVNLNTNLRTVGQPAIADPPIQESVLNMVSIAPVAAEGATTLFLFGLNFAGANTVPANTTLVITGCAPVSAGVSFVSSQMREFSTIVTGSNTNTTNLWNDYVARFGAPVAGDKIFIGCNAINTNTGQAGVPLKLDVIVAA